MFVTSTMTPPSAFHLVPTLHFYRPTMPSIGSNIPSDNNEKENNDKEEGPIWDTIWFIFRLNYVIFKLGCHVCMFSLNVRLSCSLLNMFFFG